MKLAFIVIAGLLSLSAFAQELAEHHAQICDGIEDDCQVVFTLSSKPLMGKCEGLLRNTTKCTINYIHNKQSQIHVVCGDQMPLIKNEILAASGQSYNVSALVKKADKKEVLVNDPSLYTHLQGKTVSMFMSRLNGLTSGSVVLLDKGVPQQLTLVKCN